MSSSLRPQSAREISATLKSLKPFEIAFMLFTSICCQRSNGRFQRRSLVGFFRRESGEGFRLLHFLAIFNGVPAVGFGFRRAAELAVSRVVLVHRVQQVEHFLNRVRAQIEMLA